MRHTVLMIAAMMLAGYAEATTAAQAEADDGKPPSTGLSVFVNAGGYSAAANAAEFYGGYDSNPNKINNILHSNQYGPQIWDRLVNAGLISPSDITSYSAFTVAEFPPGMDYKLAYQIGLGFRYDYDSGFGWLLRFDMAKLQATGAFNLYKTNGPGVMGNDQYITCGVFGKENRYNIDIAVTKTVAFNDAFDIEVDLGASLVNVKVQENAMEIGGSTYSILDRTDGQIPDLGMAEYDYQNQGRIGYGVFVSALVGYRVGIGAIKLGYTCYQSRITFIDRKVWGWQHMFGLRLEMNNFSFL